MKDAIAGIVITAALIVVCSIFDLSSSPGLLGGLNPQQSGEYGIVLPSGGELPAEPTQKIYEYNLYEQTESDLSEDIDNKQSECGKLGQGKEQSGSMDMNEIIVAFWHGVSAVLIGEACALVIVLILATVWLRRK